VSYRTFYANLFLFLFVWRGSRGPSLPDDVPLSGLWQSPMAREDSLEHCALLLCFLLQGLITSSLRSNFFPFFWTFLLRSVYVTSICCLALFPHTLVFLTHPANDYPPLLLSLVYLFYFLSAPGLVGYSPLLLFSSLFEMVEMGPLLD